MRQIGESFKVLSVDVHHRRLDPAVRRDSDILFVESRSTVPAIAERIRLLKSEFPDKISAIPDSDHSMNHVLAEVKLLRPLLSAGDYLIVEDSMLNGHPVLPGWGPGPHEAIDAYEHEFPNDYTHDVARENKFGWTFALNGWAWWFQSPAARRDRRVRRAPGKWLNAARAQIGSAATKRRF
jgi:cephalosporin hydroxylase